MMVVTPRGSAALAATTASLLLRLLLLLLLSCDCCRSAVTPPPFAAASAVAAHFTDKHHCWKLLCEHGYFDRMECDCSLLISADHGDLSIPASAMRASGIETQKSCSEKHWLLALASFWRERSSVGVRLPACEAAAHAARLSSLPSGARMPPLPRLMRAPSRRAIRSSPKATEASEAPREADGASIGSKQERLERYLDDVRMSLAAELSATTEAPDSPTLPSDFSTGHAASSGSTADLATDAATTSVGIYTSSDALEFSADIQETTFSTPRTDDSSGSSSSAQRRKRDAPIGNGTPFALARTPLKWRVISYWPGASPSDQETVFAAALRQWAAATPLCFSMDRTSDVGSVDILLGFYSGVHGGDNRTFDGPGGQLAHSIPGVFSHFDADESWYTGTTQQTGVALLPVALHELGLVVGLSPSDSPTAIMNNNYVKTVPEVLLGDADRAAVRNKYGVCHGSFDAAVDVQYLTMTLDDNGNVVQQPLYQTYFFRGGFSWLYSNRLGRPADYQPLNIASAWTGLPNSIDAVVQYVADDVYQLLFFKGSTVYIYSYSGQADGVIQSHPISTFFHAGSLDEPIPNNIDSAYFDPRDGNVYFFKDSLVYVYRYNATGGEHSCCVSKSNISQVFPPAAGESSVAIQSGLSYQHHVDAVYRSLSNDTIFFLVGDYVWANRGFDSSSTVVNNSMVYLGYWSSYWHYVCDVTC